MILSMLATRGWLPALVKQMAESDPGLAGGVAQLGQAVYPALERELAPAEAKVLAGARDGVPDGNALLAAMTWTERGLSILPAQAAPKGYDARARAKLADVAGAALRLAGVLDGLLRDPDARVRANAVEALWNTPQAAGRMRSMLRDSHHRVRVNALTGLVLAGEQDGVEGLVEMAERGDRASRIAAFWGMGRSGDIRFQQFLRNWRISHRNESETLRGSLAALVRLRQAETLSRARNARMRILGAAAAGGSVRIDVVVPGAPREADPEFGSAHLQPWCGEDPVWSYRARKEASCVDCRVLFLAPAGTQREAWEQRWEQARGAFPGRGSFDVEALEGPLTHVVRLGEDAPGVDAARERMTPETRQYTLTGTRQQDVEEAFDDVLAALRGVWVVRFGCGEGAREGLTLRLRSPMWTAGPAPVTIPPEPVH